MRLFYRQMIEILVLLVLTESALPVMALQAEGFYKVNSPEFKEIDRILENGQAGLNRTQLVYCKSAF